MLANVLAKVWAYFDQGRAHSEHPWPIAYRQPEEERVAMLRAFGVRRFSALAYPHKPGMAAWLNGRVRCHLGVAGRRGIGRQRG